MILQRAVIVSHLVEEDLPIECILLVALVLALIDLLPHPILQLHVLALPLHQLVELDGLVKLVAGVGLWRFIEGWFADFIHHFAVLG